MRYKEYSLCFLKLKGVLKISLHINDQAPNFVQKSTKGDLKFYDYIDGKWTILFSHPKDFTPVCTTELAEVAKLDGEFKKRDVKVIALSVDKLEEHTRWIADIEAYGKIKVDYPIIADEDRSVSLAYDMIHPKADDTFKKTTNTTNTTMPIVN